MGFLTREEGTVGGLEEALDDAEEQIPFALSLAPLGFNSKQFDGEKVGVFGGGTLGLSLGATALMVFFPSVLNTVDEEAEG